MPSERPIRKEAGETTPEYHSRVGLLCCSCRLLSSERSWRLLGEMECYYGSLCYLGMNWDGRSPRKRHPQFWLLASPAHLWLCLCLAAFFGRPPLFNHDRWPCYSVMCQNWRLIPKGSWRIYPASSCTHTVIWCTRVESGVKECTREGSSYPNPKCQAGGGGRRRKGAWRGGAGGGVSVSRE